MGFWIRYAALILICIVGPLGFAFFEDTQSELRRAGAAGEAGARAAPRALASQLSLEAHRSVGEALRIAQGVVEAGLISQKTEDLDPALDAVAGKSEGERFVWLADQAGRGRSGRRPR